eukprot:jgi/Chlat1/3110/Chrsp21S03393
MAASAAASATASLWLALLLSTAAVSSLAADAGVVTDPSSSSSVAASAASLASEAVIARFQEYLRIRTDHSKPDYDKAADFILKQAAELGLSAERRDFVPGKPVLLLTWLGSDPSLPCVLLNSHMDVVPAEEARWEGGEAFGADMKCVGQQYLESIRRLLLTPFVPLRTVRVLFVPDEEVSGRDGMGAFVESEMFKSLDIAMALDEGLANPAGTSSVPTLRAFHAERAPWWLIVKAVGLPGHGSRMYDEGCAAEALGRSLGSVRSFRAAQMALWKSGLVAEGDVISPSEAEFGLDIRVPPEADVDALEKMIAEDWAPASRNMSYHFKQKRDASNPWWSVFRLAVRRSGFELTEEVFPAATDGRFMREKGVPVLGFSPMYDTPVLLHDHNEYLAEDVYLKGIDVYVEVISALASQGANVGSAAGPRSNTHTEL